MGKSVVKSSLFCVFVLIVVCSVGQCGEDVHYVKSNGGDDSITNDGLSWATAKKRIQTAMYSAEAGDQVWVCGGPYVVGDSVVVKSGVALYGGFEGVE
ncbi:MAG: hypothetical protein EHM13_07075, partial [Acidobacteria bacterium]